MTFKNPARREGVELESLMFSKESLGPGKLLRFLQFADPHGPFLQQPPTQILFFSSCFVSNDPGEEFELLDANIRHGIHFWGSFHSLFLIEQTTDGLFIVKRHPVGLLL